MLRLRLTNTRRRIIARAAIGFGVLTGHALIFALICWPQPVKTSVQLGDTDQVTAVSLVNYRVPTPVLLPAQKPEIMAHTAAPVAPPEGEMGTLTSVESSQPRLHEEDAAALAQFEPALMPGEPDSPCQLTATLAGIFAQSPLVQRGLEGLPASQRSVANAVMLWDGQWSDDTLTGGKAILRALLVKAVASGRADCLSQINTGPVLFLVPDRQATAVLAIGSGTWTWGDLLKTDQPVAVSVTASNYLEAPASRFTPGP